MFRAVFLCLLYQAVVIVITDNHVIEKTSNSANCPVSDIDACGTKGVCDCSSNEMIVNCTGRNLSSMPSNILTSVNILMMSKNRISCVPVHFFEQFTELRKLEFRSNILDIPFILPPSLVTIDLSYNKLQNAEMFFTHCDELRKVTLSGNPISYLGGDVLRSCPVLAEFDLAADDSLETIHQNAFSTACKSLSVLFLRNLPNLKELPASLLKGCDNLQIIDMPSSGLVDIAPSTFQPVHDLDYLDISEANFTFFDSQIFRYLNKVNVLILSSMNLQKVPETLFRNTSIGSSVDLASNFLREIPEELFNSPYVTHALTVVTLSGNLLTSIPKKLFQNLHRLVELYLDGNKLRELPVGLLSGLTVEKVYAFANNISSLTSSLFENDVKNSSLTILQVHDNPVQNLTNDFLLGIAENGIVTLSCNNLAVPRYTKKIDVSCVPSTYVTTVDLEGRTFHMFAQLQRRGFECVSWVRSYVQWLAKCTSCVVGTYGSMRKSKCVPCPRGGFYQDKVGQYSKRENLPGCKPCNNGTFVRRHGGKSPLDCEVCPEGTDKTRPAMYRACYCLDGYSRRDRFGKCELCSSEGMNCVDDFVTIKPGYYWNWSYTSVDIYKQFVRNLQTRNDSYQESTVVFSEALPWVHKCPQTFKCMNDINPIDGNCKTGYRGWMCTDCEKGFFSVFSFCRKCPDFKAFLAEIGVILVLVTCFLGYVVYTYHREHSRTTRSIVDVALARGKIVLAFYQIMGEFWNSLDVVYWPDVFKKLTDWIDILQFNISAILIKPNCFFPNFSITPYVEFIVGVSVPLVIIGITTLILIVGRVYKKYVKHKNPSRLPQVESKLLRIRDKLFTLALLALYVTYSSTCNVTFALYRPSCDTYYLDEKQKHIVSLLRSDYSIDCNSDTHFWYERSAYVASVYVVGFPGILYYLLWRHSRKGHQEEETVNPDGHNVYPKWLRFLCENYNDRFWFWEIIELIRKVSQTFTIILFGWSSSFSITVTLTLAVIFLTLHASYGPMRDRFEHYLQLASLWAIFLNMLVAAVPVPALVDSQIAQTAMGIVLIILNFSVVCIIFGRPVVWIIKVIKSSGLVHSTLEALRKIIKKCYSIRSRADNESLEILHESHPIYGNTNNYHSI